MSKIRFPLAIEQEMGDIFSSVIRRVYKQIKPVIIAKYKSHGISTDAMDSNPIDDIWKDITAFSNSKTMTLRLDRLHRALTRMTSGQIAAATRSLKGLPDKESRAIVIEKSFTDPDILNMKESFITQEKGLLESSGKTFIEEVQGAAHDTFINGGSLSDLTSTIQDVVGVSESKAKFWGQDQMGDAYSAYTQKMHEKGGIENYEWRTMGDNAVRGSDPKDETSHVQLNKRIFSWAKGAAHVEGAFSKPGAENPGQDYRCRCIGVPSFKDAE